MRADDPAETAPPNANKSEQIEREAAALRANLRRRKQQMQARNAAQAVPPPRAESDASET